MRRVQIAPVHSEKAFAPLVSGCAFQISRECPTAGRASNLLHDCYKKEDRNVAKSILARIPRMTHCVEQLSRRFRYRCQCLISSDRGGTWHTRRVKRNRMLLGSISTRLMLQFRGSAVTSEPLVGIHTSRQSCCRPQKREYSCQFRRHPGNSG